MSKGALLRGRADSAREGSLGQYAVGSGQRRRRFTAKTSA